MIRPQSNQVLLEPEDDPTASKGGIFFADGAMEDVLGVAKVVAVGPGKVGKKGKREPMGVRPGDRVALLRFHLDNMYMDGIGYALVAESDLWGVLES